MPIAMFSGAKRFKYEFFFLVIYNIIRATPRVYLFIFLWIYTVYNVYPFIFFFFCGGRDSTLTLVYSHARLYN